MRLQEIQLGHQLGAVDGLDGCASPPVVGRIEEELAGAIEPAAADPDRPVIGRRGTPSHLCRMPHPEVRPEHVNRSMAEGTTKMNVEIPWLGSWAGLSRSE